jgi:hypothetical protein
MIEGGENLFLEGDDFADVQPMAVREVHMGCPKSWLKRVFVAVHGKHELMVALYLYHWHVVRKSRTIAVTNGELAELGIRRTSKYRALDRLERAGIIKIKRRLSRQALEVTLKIVR